MKEIFNTVLENGEELLWYGRPEKFETMDKTHKSGVVRNAIIAVVVTIALIAGYIYAAGNNGAGIKSGIIIIIAAIGVYSVLSPFVHASSLSKKVIYAISNKRIFVCRDDVKGAAFDNFDCAALKKDEDGHVSLLCGKDAMKLAVPKWREEASFGLRLDSETGTCKSLVWYAIPETEKVEPLLRKYLPIE